MVTGKPAASLTKSTYRPHIRIVDADRGLYTVQSQRYVHVLYLVDAVNGTCECEAGQRGFQGVKQFGGACKHLHICRQYHQHREAARKAAVAQTYQGAAGLMEAFGA
jgi:hypothetical protein